MDDGAGVDGEVFTLKSLVSENESVECGVGGRCGGCVSVDCCKFAG